MEAEPLTDDGKQGRRGVIHGLVNPTAWFTTIQKAGTALDHVLPECRLRLSPFESTNDPKETKSWHFSLWSSRYRNEDHETGRKIGVELSATLKQNTTLACFCTDNAPLSGDHTRDILNRGYCKPRMWAQYADNHRGVCLVFRKDALVQKIAEQSKGALMLARKVSYRNRKLIQPISPHAYMIDWDVFDALGPAMYARHHVAQYHVPLFFEKLQDWRDECEWRVVVLGPEPGPLYVNFGQALVGVIHGDNIDERMSWSIAEMTEGSSVEHMGLRWRNSVPWYHYEAGRWTATMRRANASRRPK
jgi:hypothetical protein